MTLQFYPPAFEGVIYSLRREGRSHDLLAGASTPDGLTLLTTHRDGTLQVWDSSSGRRLQTIKRHAPSFVGPSVAVSADGETAVSSSGDATVRVWNLASGQALRTLEGHTDAVRSVALTPDGRVALSASEDNTLRVWDLASGRAVRVLQAHTHGVRAVAVSPDARVALSAGVDAPPQRATLRAWDVASGQTPSLPPSHFGPVTSVALAPNARTAVSVGRDRALWIWDTASGQAVDALEAPTSTVRALAVTPDGRAVIAADREQSLHVWELASGQVHGVPGVGRPERRARAVPPADEEAWAYIRLIRSVAVSPDGGTLAVGARTGADGVWELTPGRPARFARMDTGSIFLRGAALTPDGRAVIYKHRDGTLRVQDLASGRVLLTLEGHASIKCEVAVAPDGRTAISAGDRTLRIWDLPSGQAVRVLPHHSASVAVAPGGRTAVSAGRDHTLRVWDLASGTCEAVYFLGAEVTCLSAIAAGGRFACGTWDGQIHFLTLRKTLRTPLPVTAARLFHIQLPKPLHEGRAAKLIGRFRQREPDHLASATDQEPHSARSGAERQVTRSSPLIIREGTQIRGKYDATFTATCPSCGQGFVPPSAVLRAITAISHSAGFSPQRSRHGRERALSASAPSVAPSAAPPHCFGLPAQAWDEPRLLSECPHCHASLRFNPFVAGRRE